MMQPFAHPDCNLELAPPRDWDAAADGECITIPAQHIKPGPGLLPIWRTWWKPSAAQLQRLVAGEAVVLEIVGAAHPPVSVDVTGVSEGPVSLTQILNDLDAHGIKIGL